MGQFIVEDMPTDEVKGYCRLQKANGATSCIGADNGNGTSDVTVTYPDVEKFSATKERLNR